MIAANPDGVPRQLVESKQWVLWRYEQRINRKTGEVTSTKVPISYHTGKPCDVTDPRSWTSFANVVAALGKSAAWDGIGFCFGPSARRDG
jgi:primase-polymerase (primpol)-like protein